MGIADKKHYLTVYQSNGTFETMITDKERSILISAMADSQDLIVDNPKYYRFISFRSIESLRIDEMSA